MSDVIHGTCLCGRVKFDVGSAQALGTCHCTRCTRWTGTGGSTVVVAPSKGFKVTGGQELVKRYHEEKFADRYFCSHCGSGIYADGGDTYYVSAGVLKDLDLEPVFHCQVAYKAPWDEIGGSAPQFAEYPPQ
jgi:hypothetical protein